MAMLWIKILHIFFVVAWFAGLFYLPRIFVNLAQQADHPDTYACLLGMARRLYSFTSLLAMPAVMFGLALYGAYGIGLYGPGNGWMHAKLLLVALLIGYHLSCGAMLARFERHANKRSHTFYRWYNEITVLLLFGIVTMVVLKPF